jgi:hypothetical protein
MTNEELAGIFMEMFAVMRDEARQALEAFVRAYLAQLGGQLAILAPSRPNHRPLVEAGYRSERFVAITA